MILFKVEWDLLYVVARVSRCDSAGKTIGKAACNGKWDTPP